VLLVVCYVTQSSHGARSWSWPVSQCCSTRLSSGWSENQSLRSREKPKCSRHVRNLQLLIWHVLIQCTAEKCTVTKAVVFRSNLIFFAVIVNNYYREVCWTSSWNAFFSSTFMCNRLIYSAKSKKLKPFNWEVCKRSRSHWIQFCWFVDVVFWWLVCDCVSEVMTNSEKRQLTSLNVYRFRP